ncbi:hypothetical protein ACOSQ3_010670 [Xanthoceras sorbifolium]
MGSDSEKGGEAEPSLLHPLLRARPEYRLLGWVSKGNWSSNRQLLAQLVFLGLLLLFLDFDGSSAENIVSKQIIGFKSFFPIHHGRLHSVRAAGSSSCIRDEN